MQTAQSLAKVEGQLHRCGRSWQFCGIKAKRGALAQLVARFNGIEEVTGSTPVRSKFLYSKFLFVTDSNNLGQAAAIARKSFEQTAICR
jgi:hypothetical protein